MSGASVARSRAITPSGPASRSLALARCWIAGRVCDRSATHLPNSSGVGRGSGGAARAGRPANEAASTNRPVNVRWVVGRIIRNGLRDGPQVRRSATGLAIRGSRSPGPDCLSSCLPTAPHVPSQFRGLPSVADHQWARTLIVGSFPAENDRIRHPADGSDVSRSRKVGPGGCKCRALQAEFPVSRYKARRPNDHPGRPAADLVSPARMTHGSSGRPNPPSVNPNHLPRQVGDGERPGILGNLTRSEGRPGASLRRRPADPEFPFPGPAI